MRLKWHSKPPIDFWMISLWCSVIFTDFHWLSLIKLWFSMIHFRTGLDDKIKEKYKRINFKWKTHHAVTTPPKWLTRSLMKKEEMKSNKKREVPNLIPMTRTEITVNKTRNRVRDHTLGDHTALRDSHSVWTITNQATHTAGDHSAPWYLQGLGE
jgi:hypothetical protein